MDFHALPRRDLQALAKRNGIRANMTNGAMADALAALPAVDGIEEYVQQPVAEPVVQATAEEEEEKEAPAPEKQEISLPGSRGAAHAPDEVIVLDDSEEDKDLTPDEDEEKALARGVGRRRVAWAEPLAATATRKRAAACKADTAEAVAEAVPARATRARSQRTVESVGADEAPKRTVETDADTADAVPEAVPARATRARSQMTVESVAADDAPKTRRTSRGKAGTQQEEEEKATQGDASDVDPAMPAPVSSDEGGDSADEMEAAMDAQNGEQKAPVEEQSQEVEGENEKEDAAAVAVPARATRARNQSNQSKVLSAAEEVAPKTRRASRRTMDAQDEEQHAPVEERSQEVEGGTEKEDTAAAPVPARATRARSQRTVTSVAEEEALKTRRTSRRAVAKNNSTEQEDEEKATQGDVSDVEAAVPAPVSSHEEADGSEEMEEAMDAQNAPIEVQSEEDEGENEKGGAAVEAVPARATRARRQRMVMSVAEKAMPARATRARSQKTVMPVAEEEPTKGRRTSRRAAAKKTSTEQEEEEKRTQADVPAPVSSDEEQNEPVSSSEEMEAATDAQNEEQTTLVEEPSQEDETAINCSSNLTTAVSKTETPMARRTSRRLSSARRTGTMHEEVEQGQQPQDAVSEVETTVPAPASSDEEADVAEEMEAAMDAQNEEQNAAVEKQSQEYEEVVADGTPLVEEEPVAAEDCPVYSSAVEQTDTVSSEEIQHSSEDTEMVPVQEVTEEVDFSSDVSEENEDGTAEEEPPVAEDVDSSVQEPLVDVQQWEATEEIHLACEERCEATVNEVPQATLPSGEATKEIGFASDVEHASEENEECKVEVEIPVAEDVQQCEATEEIQLASEDTEIVPVQEISQAVLESGEATEGVDCTSDVDEENEEFEEEPTLAEHVDSSVQEPLVDVQQCEATKKIQVASEDTEMLPVLESGEATEEVDFTIDVVHASEENDVPASEEVLQSAAKISEKKKDMAAEEATLVATDEMPQMLEAMDEGVAEVITIDYLSQANGEGGAVKESGFTADLTDVSMEEETVVAAEEECVEEEVVTVDYLSQATVTDDEGAVKESGFSCGLTDVSAGDGVVAADVMLQSSATKGENAEEVVAVDNQSESMVTDDEVHVKESGFTGELLDVFIEEQGVVADNEMIHSSAKIEENVEEVVTVDNMWQATVTDDEAKEDVMEANEMQVSSATIEKSVELVVTVDQLSHAIMADDEWAVTESAFTGECTPVVDTARNFSDQIASPWFANVFEDAAKSLSMDSITVEPMAKITHSPLTIRKLRRAVAEENEADDVPLCIFTSSSAGDENTAEPVLVEEEKEVNRPEAALAKIKHSPLTIRKLRRAVAEENEADDVPLCIFTSSSGGEENTAEPVLVEQEKEVNEPEEALAKITHSPLTIRKLRRAVAEENEADDVPLCIFTGSSGDKENSAEPLLSLRKLKTEFNQIVAVAQENEVKEGEKSSQPLDKLSLRKLRTKLKETLNAHKNMEPKRVPLGRLDENAC